ncbi:MAG: hypothetical protein FJW20_00140 [Acidimicrobiia bacterium]|nr:hypothetical protein [Acidimicrobiia bacterium]
MSQAPERILPRFVERVWGSRDLGPWFPPAETPTGEVWFDAGPLLIKFLFTSQPLSVQVHPDDDYARRVEDSRGKTEMWLILRAGPQARIACGFREPVSLEQVRVSASDGSIESLLGWFTPKPGDVFFTPAGTVHALGPDLAVLEIQQNSDVTYRLYDYNRGRPLHLDRGMEVVKPEAHPGPSLQQDLPGGGRLLATCDYFATERWQLSGPATVGPGCYIVLEGSGRLGNEVFSPGEVWQSGAGLEIQPDSQVTIVRTYVP